MSIIKIIKCVSPEDPPRIPQRRKRVSPEAQGHKACVPRGSHEAPRLAPEGRKLKAKIVPLSRVAQSGGDAVDRTQQGGLPLHAIGLVLAFIAILAQQVNLQIGQRVEVGVAAGQ